MNILARLPVPSVQHEGIQNVQRIEEEMGVDLLLEVEVLELGEVGAILFLLGVAAGRDGIFNHVDH